jgi:DNA-directed RNA polymerase specialized sigma24 family protein
MLCQESKIRVGLRNLALRAANSSAELEDMLEEARTYLWLAERDSPGQTDSWYLECCHHHLVDVRRRGRSVDSPKSANSLLRLDDEQQNECDRQAGEGALLANDDTFSVASAHDLYRELDVRLDESSRTVLRLLVEGRTVREAARMTGISASSVQARVGAIRATAKRLGI